MMAPSAAPPKRAADGAVGLGMTGGLARRDIAGARRGIAAAEHIARTLILRRTLRMAPAAALLVPAEPRRIVRSSLGLDNCAGGALGGSADWAKAAALISASVNAAKVVVRIIDIAS